MTDKTFDVFDIDGIAAGADSGDICFGSGWDSGLKPLRGSSRLGLISALSSCDIIESGVIADKLTIAASKSSNETSGGAGFISFVVDFLGPTFIPSGIVGRPPSSDVIYKFKRSFYLLAVTASVLILEIDNFKLWFAV